MLANPLQWQVRLLSAVFGVFILIFPLQIAIGSKAENEEALEKVRRDIGRMQKEIRETQMLHDSVQKELLTLEIELAKRLKELKYIRYRIDKQNDKLNNLYVKRKGLNKDLKTQHNLLAEQIRSAYMMGRQEYLKIILNLEDKSSIGRTMTYYDYFNRARLQRIKHTNNTLASLEQVEKEINAQTEVLKQERKNQIAKKNELTKVSESRAIVVAKLHKELQEKGDDLAGLQEDERRLEKLIRDLDKAMPEILTATGNRTPFAKLKGKLSWPTKGKLSANFGKKRKAGNVRWNGVMIEAKSGQDVKAVSHGRVAFAEFLRGYGLLLILDHGDGYMSLYGYNQTIYKEIGEWVETGETIASIGSSGGQKESALYFEIRYNGKPDNPVIWCSNG